jgi:hypothetical protein
MLLCSSRYVQHLHGTNADQRGAVPLAELTAFGGQEQQE